MKSLIFLAVLALAPTSFADCVKTSDSGDIKQVGKLNLAANIDLGEISIMRAPEAYENKDIAPSVVTGVLDSHTEGKGRVGLQGQEVVLCTRDGMHQANAFCTMSLDVPLNKRAVLNTPSLFVSKEDLVTVAAVRSFTFVSDKGTQFAVVCSLDVTKMEQALNFGSDWAVKLLPLSLQGVVASTEPTERVGQPMETITID